MNVRTMREDAVLQSGGVSDEVVYQLFVEIIEKINARGRLLDFGAGKGKLLELLFEMKRFTTLTGIDLYNRPKAIPESIDWHTQDLNNITSYPSQSFDIVVSAEVIEHLENPRAAAREWYRILAPNGLLIFSTPNNESIRSILSLIMKGHYVFFLDSSYPAHITPVLQKDAERILLEAGFTELETHYSNQGGIPKLPKISWQQISFNILGGKRFSDNMLVVARKNNNV